VVGLVERQLHSHLERALDVASKPLSDARLAESLKAAGVPVARRTVAKYREAMHIGASHERIRIN
jgi:RNA polymerase sigma-54 factor